MASILAHPVRIPDARPPDRPYEDVELTTADGFEIRGWFVPAPGGSSRTVLLEHGIGANRSLTLPMLVVADRLRANALMLDLRGHGESGGHTTSFGCREGQDVEAGVRWLRSARPEQSRQVVAFGLSLSTAATVFAAARIDPPFDAVVLDSSFAAPVELADGVLRRIPQLLRPLLIAPGVPLASLETGCWMPNVRPVDAIAHVRAPIWIAHADGDPLIPVAQGRRMYEAAVEPKSWFEAHGTSHLASNADPEGWLASLGAFLDRMLAEPR
jgi:pimeloyl-ACP methyl ester carboxylesterase